MNTVFTRPTLRRLVWPAVLGLGLALLLLRAGLIAGHPAAGHPAVVPGLAAPLRSMPINPRLRQLLEDAPAAPVVPVAPVSYPPLQVPAALLSAHSEAEAVAPPLDVDHAIVLRYGSVQGGWVFPITPEQLRAATVQAGKGKITLDRAKLRGYLAPVAEALAAPAADATLALSKGQAVLTPDVTGLVLDLDAAVARITGAASTANRVVALPVKAVAANVKAATLRPIQQQAQILLDRGFVLHYNSDDYTLKPATINRFLILVAQDNAKALYAIGLDHAKLLDTLDVVAEQVNVPARDPLYRLVDNQVQVMVEARPGRKLDYDATAAAMEAAFNGGTNRADMVVVVREPSISAADVANIQTPDLLSKASTSFSGSVSARAYNVRFGATLVDGALIPPGAIFSMNEALGPLTLERGFKMGFGITRDGKGNLTTVPSEAGGICQVATTFFQSAYWAGLTIVERRGHSYWIPRYGQSATGRKGLDATISPPEQDLRVRNTTGNWIRVHAFSNGETMLFELYGTNPGWTVKVSDPVVKNIVKADETPIYEKSDLLPANQTVMVEHAQAGFTATITRKVTAADGSPLDTLTLTSTYDPAHNRYLTGTGKDVPKP